MSHPPTYTLLPHFHKIEACTRPLRSEQAAGYNTATREDRPGAGRGLALHYPGTLPGHLRKFFLSAKFQFPQELFQKAFHQLF